MTRPYVFFPAADKRQDAMWTYSYRMWGVAQANAYVRGLHQHLEKLASRQVPWKVVPWICEGETVVYMSRYARHLIFFRALPDQRIGVMTILHEAMDIPARLAEDLRQVCR
jgi:toxin ParE1/3/4